MKTPCVKICKLIDSVCIGCGRTSEQITMWSKYTDKEREKIIKEFQSDLRDYKISKIDGMRLENECGWALIRASNTQPALTMRFESNTEENLNILQKYVKDKIIKAIGMQCEF